MAFASCFFKTREKAKVGEKKYATQGAPQEISVEAAVAAALPEVDGIFTLKEAEQTALELKLKLCSEKKKSYFLYSGMALVKCCKTCDVHPTISHQ